MAGVKVSNGVGFVPVQDIAVSTGAAFRQAKKMHAWNGSSWILTWVPKVPTVTVTFSKTGVNVGEGYNVVATLSIPAPEGTVVTFTFPNYSLAIAAVEGATTVTLPGASHATAGSYAWTATAVNLGGTTASAAVTQTVTAAVPTHHHEVVPSGSSGVAIQQAMDRAYNHFIANMGGTTNFDDENTFACVELVAGGLYDLAGTELHFRRGVRLVGGGSGATRPTVKGTNPSTHTMNTDNNGGGLYNSPHYDWLVTNIQFDCMTFSGGFSISHTKRFRVSNCFFKNMGGKKHYIEVNSSGGLPQPGVWNCQIIDCEFINNNTTTTNGEPRRCEDECVQLDYSWAGAASAMANDGTVANNVLVQGCWFHHCPRGVGGHHHGDPGNASRHPPVANHSNILIQNNTFENVDPDAYGGGDAPNGTGSEGAVRCYTWNNVQILNNTFKNCYQPINLYCNADSPTATGNPTYFRIAGNVIDGKPSTRPGINSSSAHASKKLEQVLAENNTAQGTWGGSGYFIGFGDTGAQDLPASTYGVVIRNNRFQPSNLSVAQEKSYNKYKADGADNGNGVYLFNNTVSDGSVDDS